MEDREKRRGEAGGKRGLFAPIVLALLTFSLIGNVFLYAKQLQSTQTQRQEEGLAIIRQQIGAKAYFAGMTKQLGILTAASDDDKRLAAAYELGITARGSTDVLALIGKAAAIAPDASGPPPDAASKALDRIEQSLGRIAAHAGKPSRDELAYLSGLSKLYGELSDSAGKLSTEFQTKEAALQAQAGGAWVDAAKQWSRLLVSANALTLPA